MKYEELPKPIPIGNATDYTGYKCGTLTVLYRVPKKNKTHTPWACICTCGGYCIRDIDTLKRGIGKCDSLHNHNNLVGKKFGKLMPIHRLDDYVHERGWLYECLCECGNIKQIREKDFLYGKTISCECSKKEYVDLTGKKIGKLTVLNLVEGERIHNSYVWLCKCECGNLVKIRSSQLYDGSTRSCGCITSIGEYNIKQILNNNNISYEHQWHTSECRFPDTNKQALFDFYINDDKKGFILEFDGGQHERPADNFFCKNNFLYTRNHDLYKNQWAWEHNIPIKRIPYKYRDCLNLQDIMSDRFLITPKENPKWFPKKSWTYPYFSLDDTEVLP